MKQDTSGTRLYLRLEQDMNEDSLEIKVITDWELMSMDMGSYGMQSLRIALEAQAYNLTPWPWLKRAVKWMKNPAKRETIFWLRKEEEE